VLAREDVQHQRSLAVTETAQDQGEIGASCHAP
jgi:hypothetical protein